MKNMKNIVRPLLLTGILSLSQANFCYAASFNVGATVQQARKTVKKGGQTRKPAAPKKAPAGTKNIVTTYKGQRIYITFKKQAVYYNNLDKNNNIVSTKRSGIDLTDCQVVDIRCYNGLAYAIVNLDLESPRVMSLGLFMIDPSRDYNEQLAEGNEMEFDDANHKVKIRTITGLAGDTEADGFTFENSEYVMQ